MQRRILREKIIAVLACAIAGTVVGCAGGVAQGGGGGSSGRGFEHGAEQSTLEEALEPLDEVTLTLQSYAGGPDSIMAGSSLAFKDYVEERSGGKITIDLIWGQAIASYSEVDDALLDGRLDMAMTMPLYHPDQYPVHNAISQLSVFAPSGQIAGSAATYATMGQLAWENESLVEEYESKGLTLLDPMADTGQYGTWCSEPSSAAGDLQGETISVSTAGNQTIVSSLGGSPVFMEFTETFEALERRTVRCTLINQPVAATSGVVEAAPHLVYSKSGSPSRASATLVAGSSFDSLPLAYQQIIFDAQETMFNAWISHIAEATTANYEMSSNNGGSFAPFDDESQKLIDEAQESLVRDEVESGNLDQDVADRARGLGEEWLQKVYASGVPEDGELADFTNWYDADEYDVSDFAAVYFADVMESRRPA